ncbi:MAG: F-box protein [Chlamydiales bacterium]
MDSIVPNNRLLAFPPDEIILEILSYVSDESAFPAVCKKFATLTEQFRELIWERLSEDPVIQEAQGVFANSPNLSIGIKLKTLAHTLYGRIRHGVNLQTFSASTTQIYAIFYHAILENQLPLPLHKLLTPTQTARGLIEAAGGFNIQDFKALYDILQQRDLFYNFQPSQTIIQKAITNAVAGGKVDTVEFLIHLSRRFNGDELLLLAVRRNNPKIITLILRSHLTISTADNPNAGVDNSENIVPNSGLQSAFFGALIAHDLDVLNALLDNSRPSQELLKQIRERAVYEKLRAESPGQHPPKRLALPIQNPLELRPFIARLNEVIQ